MNISRLMTVIAICLAIPLSGFARKHIKMMKDKHNRVERSIPSIPSVEAWLEDNDKDISLQFYRNLGPNSFKSVYNNFAEKSDLELENWVKQNNYISLNEVYKKAESSFVAPKRNLDTNEIEISVPNKIKDQRYATLFNQKGVFLIQDTIYKVKEQYVYVIEDGNFDKVKEIENGTDYSTLKSVSRFVHTSSLQSKILTRGPQYDRSPVFKVTSKRREHVKFESWVSKIQNQGAQVIAEMEGRAQTKTLWWGITFSDELVWGQVRFNYGSFNGKYGYTTFGQSWGKKQLVNVKHMELGI